MAGGDKKSSGGGSVTASPLNGERRYADAIEWCNRLEAFYRWMNDANMEQLLMLERDRLSRRVDALKAVHDGTITQATYQKHFGPNQ